MIYHFCVGVKDPVSGTEKIYIYCMLKLKTFYCDSQTPFRVYFTVLMRYAYMLDLTFTGPHTGQILHTLRYTILAIH